MAVILFGIVDLLVLLFTPASLRGAALIPPFISGIVAIVLLPFVMTFFERQQARIDRQSREIETLHAMDTAIAREMELPNLLDVAVKKAVLALDAEAGGVVLFEEKTGNLSAEAYTGLSEDDPDRPGFQSLARGGACREDDAWQTACVPLTWNDGDNIPHPSGYLIAAKRQPCAPFTPADHALLSALSGTIVVAVANARALEAARDAARVRQELERERRVAEALTEGLLPDFPPQVGSWAFSKRYQPQSNEAQVGGDVYDLFPLGPGGKENRWGVVIADVSGKGLAAARQTASVKYYLRSYAREHASPAEVLARLNDALFDEPVLTGFVTLLYGVLSDEDGSFTYASAGHEPPILRRADGSFETLAPTGLVLGAMREMDYEEASVTFAPGDGLLLYTDGLSEARTPEGQFLQIEGVQSVLTRLRGCPPGSVADEVLAAARAYSHHRLADDTALVWIERCSAAAAAAAAAAPPA